MAPLSRGRLAIASSGQVAHRGSLQRLLASAHGFPGSRALACLPSVGIGALDSTLHLAAGGGRGGGGGGGSRHEKQR